MTLKPKGLSFVLEHWRRTPWRGYALGYIAGVGAMGHDLPGGLRVFLIAWSLVTMLIDGKKDEGTS